MYVWVWEREGFKSPPVSKAICTAMKLNFSIHYLPHGKTSVWYCHVVTFAFVNSNKTTLCWHKVKRSGYDNRGSLVVTNRPV
jgi:hypothetical protein